MRSRPPSPVLSTSGSRVTAAGPTRPGMPADPPGQPCTVPVYDPAAGTGRLLVLDLDPSCGCGSGELVAQVSDQAAELEQLLERLGGRYIADVSPGGGRHVFVLFAAALP